MLPNPWPANSPDWWRYRLVQKLMDKQARYDILEDYHIGDHPLPPGDARYVRWLAKFQKMARTNYVLMVNQAPVGRMRIKGFQFGENDGIDKDAKMVWAANDMDLQSKKMHSACSVFGDGYLLVGPKSEVTGFPTMIVQDPRVAVCEPDPVFPSRSMAGLRMWEDVTTDSIITVLYLPDAIYTYQSPMVTDPSETSALTNRLLGVGIYTGMDLINVEENELGEVPLIQFSWQPDFTDHGHAEAEDILHIQDRINYMILDRLKIARDQAYQQRWAKGIKPASDKKHGKDAKGPVKPPFDPGSDALWVTDNPEAEFGAFDAVDFKQILEAVRDDIADLAAISATPAHYLMNRMINVSGETLTQSESAFVSKVRLRMEAMGWGWERAMKLAFKYMGLSKATEVDANVLWGNPMVRKDVETSDAASKWIAGGMPLELAMETFGDFTPDQIEYARKAAEEAKAEEKAMAEQQMKMMAQRPGPAGAGAKPAAAKKKPAPTKT